MVRRVWGWVLLILAVIAPAVSPARGQTGSVRGAVKLSGAPPPAETLTVTKDQEVCGRAVPSRALIVTAGKVQNAVVSLEGVRSEAAAMPRSAVLSNRGCTFDPPVLAAVAGSVLTIRNEDPVFHNVRIRLSGRSLANLSLPTRNVEVRNQRALARPGLLTVQCDAHEWMGAAIRVYDHPYFAVTGADGSFEIMGVPPGKHTLAVWHGKLGEQIREIAVEPNGTVTVEFVFPK